VGADQDERFAAWLRAAARAAGFDVAGTRGSAARLAEACGLSESVVSRLMKGQSEPTPATLRRVAPVLGLNEVELFTAAYGLDAVPAPARPPVTVRQALTEWGITDAGDQALVEMLVERLRSR
jgi:transcriptional regulator with XRE-family HTH domain